MKRRSFLATIIALVMWPRTTTTTTTATTTSTPQQFKVTGDSHGGSTTIVFCTNDPNIRPGQSLTVTFNDTTFHGLVRSVDYVPGRY